MSILRKLKSLLGRDDAGAEADRDVTVTVEHDPANEAAVKGADVAESDADAEAADAAVDTEATDAAVDSEAADGSDAAGAEDAADAAAAGTDDETADEPVDALDGIGPAYAERLGDAGIDSVADLAAADAAELAETTEIAEGRIQGWIDQAAVY